MQKLSIIDVLDRKPGDSLNIIRNPTKSFAENREKILKTIFKKTISRIILNLTPL